MISINSSSLGEQIEHAIREEILSGEMKPGQRLSIDELAQRWGVSSMPVRDAVRHDGRRAGRTRGVPVPGPWARGHRPASLSSFAGRSLSPVLAAGGAPRGLEGHQA